MNIDLDAFYNRIVLTQAKNLFITQFSQHICEINSFSITSNTEIISFSDARLELTINPGRISVVLDQIPSFLKDIYQVSNVIECSLFSKALSFDLIDKPPKFLATKTELQRCELFLIAKLIENALLSIYGLEKLSEFQFYTVDGTFLGFLTRIRLIRDIFGIFHNYDCLIFAERYIIDKKDIITLKEISEIVDKDDYCFEDLPLVLDELEPLTSKPFIESEEINWFENLYRIKIPKTPIFYRIPFMSWTRHGRTSFYVSPDIITELKY
ncbi:MAG: hypothetical protein ACTSRS_00280 [Candidatus Helarchaeota archaeon]